MLNWPIFSEILLARTIPRSCLFAMVVKNFLRARCPFSDRNDGVKALNDEHVLITTGMKLLKYQYQYTHTNSRCSCEQAYVDI